MIYLVAIFGTITVSLLAITLFELASVKQEVHLVNQRWLAYKLADAPVETPEAPEIADEPETESIDASELTETELLIIEREAEFDLRIAKMKEELAFSQAPKRDNPTEAVSLHPGVQNLPHHIITDSYDSLPDVEITY